MLEYIEDGGLIPPLLVLQTLAQSRTLTVALVRGYVARQLAAESAEIQRSRDAIQKLQAETAQVGGVLQPRTAGGIAEGTGRASRWRFVPLS